MIGPKAAAASGGNARSHAELVQHLRGIYQKIGDNLESIMGELELENLDPGSEKPGELLGVLAMVTIFQYTESLTDRQAADQVRNRADWKYALRLPPRYPGFPYSFLCDFRRRVIAHEQSFNVLQTIMTRLQAFGLFEHCGGLPENAVSLVLGCCTASRISDIEDAIRNMFGKLAALYPEWLKRNTLPYWYARYGSLSERTGSDLVEENRERRALALGTDALRLLEIVEGLGDPELMALREYYTLKFQFQRQFQYEEGVVKERFLCKDERYLCKNQTLQESKIEIVRKGDGYGT